LFPCGKDYDVMFEFQSGHRISVRSTARKLGTKEALKQTVKLRREK